MGLRDWLKKTSRGDSKQPESQFILLPLTQQELFALTRALSTTGKSELTEIADKQMLDSVMDRISRWAERQGAWWDDGQKIITSVREQIDP